MDISPQDRAALIRDKYHGDEKADIRGDLERLAAGEPLAYVIGWIPFLGLQIHLDSHPLIPRPETEWWTEQLIAHLREKFGDTPFVFLDLCAGSGAIGLAVLKHLPQAVAWFGELDPAHTELIRKNAELNGLPMERIGIRESDLFAAFGNRRFHVIATNPPYIPADRKLDASVTDFEPHEALFAGKDGLSVIERILREGPDRLLPDGELWMECDITNIERAQKIARMYEASATMIRKDHHGRARLLIVQY